MTRTVLSEKTMLDRPLRLALATLASVTLLSTLAHAEGATWAAIKGTTSWEHLSERDHDDAGAINVYVAEIAGTKCLRGESLTPGKADVYLGVSMDIRAAMDWSTAGLKYSEVLGTSSSTVDYFQYLDVPGWTGASDRFWFLRGTKEVNGEVMTFWWDRMGENGGPHSARFAEVVAQNPKAVEPPLNVGGWSFVQEGANVRSRYYVCSDTGGVLPKALQYAAAKQTLPDTVGDLVREAVKRSK